MSLLPVAEAQALILALAREIDEETVPLIAASGRWLVRDITALRTQPAADLSAMDGYAIRFAEQPGPWTIVGESAAGSASTRALDPGEAARIFTGAPVPKGADTILIQEEAARNGDTLRREGEGPPHVGAHIRRRGSDFSAGDLLMPAGVRLTPAAIALAAVGGHGTLPVRRRVRIALISTGGRIGAAGEPTPGVMLPSSNAPMLAALLGRYPVEIEDHGIVTDDLESLAAAFDRARGADIIVTTGGASVGDYDLVRPALIAAGASIDFWRIAMKPGKPLMAGRLGDAAVVGLPGNPVSAFVTANLFVLPLIARTMGASDPIPRPTHGTLAGSLPATGVRAEYPRAQWVDGRVLPLIGQDSAALAELTRAAALIVRPAQTAAADIGDSVEILTLA